jgi:catalase
VGVLVSRGADAALLKKLMTAIENEGAVMEVIAPKVGGVEAADGSWIEANHMIDGGPSVLFDAVVLLLSAEGAERLTGEAAARDFVADAFAHCKFIGFTADATPLLQKAGVDPKADEGLVALDDPKSVAGFVESCRKLRLWARESSVKL